jgi:hypothetical protein
MSWDRLVATVTARRADLQPGTMFGMPCLKRADGKVLACLGKDGGITVKIADEEARAEALGLPAASSGVHAYDPARPMREWVHLPAQQAGVWQRLVELGLTDGPRRASGGVF